jgi:FkbM family methyltransferase
MKALIKKSLALAGYEITRISATEPNPFEIQKSLCRIETPVIFDVGANIGQTTHIYRNLFPRAVIYAFEPFPASFYSLKQTFANDADIRLFELALANTRGEAMLYSNALSLTNSLLVTDESAERYWGNVVRTKDQLTVKVETIDSFCDANSIDRIDVLKMDTQGTELAVLNGSRHLLESKSIGLIYFEIIVSPTYVNQPHVDEYFSFLFALHYRMIDIYNLFRKDGELLQMDVLFAAN